MKTSLLFRSRCLLSCLALAAILCLAASPAPAREPDRDALYQLSTIEALLQGLYDGVADYGALKAHGDLGLGTFDHLDGEMVAVDGAFFQVRSDGSVHPVSDSMSAPFAALTFFEPDVRLDLARVASQADLEKAILDALPGPNMPYAVKVSGRFDRVKTRSVPRQDKPYPPLAQVAKHQPVFEMQDVEGVLVGFYCPAYVKGFGVPGFHLHFLSSDRASGGHLLDVSGAGLAVELDQTPRLVLELPRDQAFLGADLAKDRSKELHKVEK